MRMTVHLGICALCCVVALIAADKVEALEYETNDKHSVANRNLVKPNNYKAGINNLQPVLEYVPSDRAMNGHQHEKREAVTHPTPLDAIQSNVRGQKLPLFADEPQFVLLRSPTLMQSDPGYAFIPQRGRKSESAATLEKRELSIKQMLESGDYFVPNRGKKRAGGGITKKIKFDDILGSDELFIPNRGKKEFLELFGGGTLNELQPFFSKKNVLSTIGGKDGDAGELFYPTRGKKNIFDELAQDTFFSSRGKRNPVIWGMLNEELNPWEFLAADDSNYNTDFTLDRYQTNKIIT